MDGREHLFWGVLIYSLTLFGYSIVFGYVTASIYVFLMLVLLVVAAISFDVAANNIVQSSKAKKHEEKVEKIKDEAMTPEERKKMLSRQMCSYLFLGLVAVLCAYVSSPLSDNPIFVIGGFIGAAFGSWLPDMDKIVADISKHRNPVSHSSLLLLALACYSTIMLPDVWVSAMLFFLGVMIGNTAHLVCDNFLEQGTVKDFFHAFHSWKECPGDIRHVRKEWNRAWLLLNAGLMVAMIFFMLARFDYIDFPWSENLVVVSVVYGQTIEPGYSVAWSYVMTAPALFVVILTLVFYGTVFVAFGAWCDEKGKKKENDKRPVHEEKVNPAAKKPSRAEQVQDEVPVVDEVAPKQRKPGKKSGKKAGKKVSS